VRAHHRHHTAEQSRSTPEPFGFPLLRDLSHASAFLHTVHGPLSRELRLGELSRRQIVG
jgi:hypothetical protein